MFGSSRDYLGYADHDSYYIPTTIGVVEFRRMSTSSNMWRIHTWYSSEDLGRGYIRRRGNLRVSNHQRAVWRCYSTIQYVLPTLVFDDSSIWDSCTIFDVPFMNIMTLYMLTLWNSIELEQVHSSVTTDFLRWDVQQDRGIGFLCHALYTNSKVSAQSRERFPCIV